MGRDAGWLAASCCVSGDVDLLVLPEVDFDAKAFLNQVQKKMALKGECYVVVSEGAHYADGTYIAAGKAAKLFQPGDHGCTFGGNPVTCAAARVVLDVVDKQFLAEVTRKGELLRQELLKLPQVESVRGRGLMLGVVLREPVAKQAVAEAPNYGILMNAPQPDVVRLTPPLIISDDQITQAVARFADLLKGVSHDD